MTNVEEVQAVARPALDRYIERLGQHDRYSESAEILTACRCGWEPPYPHRTKRANQSLGQHIRHAHRRAERLWVAERDELLRAYYR